MSLSAAEIIQTTRAATPSLPLTDAANVRLTTKLIWHYQRSVLQMDLRLRYPQTV